MEYRREIDGLRSIAVIPVILYHAGFGLFSGGFIGVDVFFVISGYLITSIIAAEVEVNRFSILSFYERRVRRILPALFTVMLVCMPFAWFFLLPEDMTRFFQSVTTVSLFSSNILFWRTSGYFDTSTELKPLIHTWSLAVEEQYYLFFPIFLSLAWRMGKRWVIGLLIALSFFSLALAQWGSATQPEAAFYLLPTRGWELLIGAIVALCLTSELKLKFSQKTNEVGSLIGILLIAYSVFMFDKSTPFPSLYTTVPTMGTALIIAFASTETFIGRLLGHSIFVGIGLISYSAYLWHQPLFAFAKYRFSQELDPALLIVLSGASFLLAYLSWKYVEKPFRQRQRFNRSAVFKFAATGTIFFIAVGAYGNYKNGFPSRIVDIVPASELNFPSYKNQYCFYSVDTDHDLQVGRQGVNCWLGNKSSNVKAILFGDSFAGQYEPFWDIVGSKTNMHIHSITTNWCYPSSDKNFTGPQSSRAYEQCIYNRQYFLDNFSKYDIVILAGSWGEVISQNKMRGVIDLIARTASKSKLVVVMASPKCYDLDPTAQYEKSLLYGNKFDINAIKSTNDNAATEANMLLSKTAKNYKNVLFITRETLFSLDGHPSPLTDDNVPYSLQNGHITIYGSKFAARSFLKSTDVEILKSLAGI